MPIARKKLCQIIRKVTFSLVWVSNVTLLEIPGIIEIAPQPISLALGFISRAESGILFWTPIAAGGMLRQQGLGSNRNLRFF